MINLPPPRPDTQRVIVHDDIVLLERSTGIVLDVLRDVLTL